MTSTITKLTPLSRPSTNLQGNEICMSNFYTDHRQFETTPEDKFQYQLILIH